MEEDLLCVLSYTSKNQAYMLSLSKSLLIIDNDLACTVITSANSARKMKSVCGGVSGEEREGVDDLPPTITSVIQDVLLP